MTNLLQQNEQQLTQDIIGLVNSAKQRAAASVNAELTQLYWTVGQRIQQQILKGERAEYGQHIILSAMRRELFMWQNI